jgi:hypothetical protein
MALVPAAAAIATGPGSMTLTLTSETPLGFFTFVRVQGPEGQQFANFDGTTATLSDLALGAYTATVDPSPATPGGSLAFTLTASEPAFVSELALPAWPTGTASITGTIVDDSGAPVSGANVSLVSPPRPFPGVSTGPDGTFAFTDLPAGEYFLSAIAFGYFSRSTQFALADGEARVVDLVLPVQNSSITGRLVDGDGNSIADTWVDARSGPDFGAAMSGPDGSFTLSGLSAGEWTIVGGGGGGGSTWLPSELVVTLASGENATIGDVVLAPRTTGIIAGSILDSSLPFTQPIVGICATLLLPNGSAVLGQVVTTGNDGTYFFTDLAPGSYKILFTDCDLGRVPPYASVYYGGSTTLGGATALTVAAGEFLNLDVTTLYPQVETPEPDRDATKPRLRDLTPATHDAIDAPVAVTQKHSFVIDVGEEYAGQWVSVWLFTPTKQLGEWHKVAADGTVEATVPKNHPAGNQQLVVQDSDDNVIGWTTMRIRKA